MKHLRWVSLLSLFSLCSSGLGAESPVDTAVDKPVVSARYTPLEIKLDGRIDDEAWKSAVPVRVERTLAEGDTIAELSTVVRVLWTDNDLYISYAAPYSRLTVFEPAISEGKRVGLWRRDVVEVFINPHPEHPKRYSEYQVAPTGERIDLMLDLPHKDFLWDSRFDSAVHVDPEAKTWTTEIRIPLASLDSEKPKSGDRWRINFYRFSTAEKAFLAWNPIGRADAHTPEMFGVLLFER